MITPSLASGQSTAARDWPQSARLQRTLVVDDGEERGQPWRLMSRGALGGVLGAAVGASAGYLIGRQLNDPPCNVPSFPLACEHTVRDREEWGTVISAAVGEIIGVPLAMRLSGDTRPRLPTAILASGITALGGIALVTRFDGDDPTERVLSTGLALYVQVRISADILRPEE